MQRSWPGSDASGSGVGHERPTAAERRAVGKDGYDPAMRAPVGVVDGVVVVVVDFDGDGDMVWVDSR